MPDTITINPPWRLDPFQNIINVSFGSYYVTFAGGSTNVGIVGTATIGGKTAAFSGSGGNPGYISVSGATILQQVNSSQTRTQSVYIDLGNPDNNPGDNIQGTGTFILNNTAGVLQVSPGIKTFGFNYGANDFLITADEGGVSFALTEGGAVTWQVYAIAPGSSSPPPYWNGTYFVTGDLVLVSQGSYGTGAPADFSLPSGDSGIIAGAQGTVAMSLIKKGNLVYTWPTGGSSYWQVSGPYTPPAFRDFGLETTLWYATYPGNLGPYAILPSGTQPF